MKDHHLEKLEVMFLHETEEEKQQRQEQEQFLLEQTFKFQQQQEQNQLIDYEERDFLENEQEVVKRKNISHREQKERSEILEEMMLLERIQPIIQSLVLEEENDRHMLTGIEIGEAHWIHDQCLIQQPRESPPDKTRTKLRAAAATTTTTTPQQLNKNNNSYMTNGISSPASGDTASDYSATSSSKQQPQRKVTGDQLPPLLKSDETMSMGRGTMVSPSWFSPTTNNKNSNKQSQQEPEKEEDDGPLSATASPQEARFRLKDREEKKIVASGVNDDDEL